MLIELFLPTGPCSPLPESPIVGREPCCASFAKIVRTCGCCREIGLLRARRGEFQTSQIKVSRQGQTPWFGRVGMNVAGRFLLNSRARSTSWPIDLLASPADLLKYGPV